jgi:hypothetical protein
MKKGPKKEMHSMPVNPCSIHVPSVAKSIPLAILMIVGTAARASIRDKERKNLMAMLSWPYPTRLAHSYRQLKKPC